MSSGIERVVARVAPDQHGLVARFQLLEAGVPPRTIDNAIAAHRLLVVHPAVYAVAGSPTSWLRTVLAATLNAGTRAAAAGRTASALWDVLPAANLPVEVLVPVATNPRGDGFVVHRTRRPFQIVTVHGIAATSVARTLEDIARAVPLRLLEEAVDKALHRRLVTLEELRGVRGPVARLAASRSASVPESVLETRFLRILRDARLPFPVTQYEIRRGAVLIARADFAYPAERVVIEIESYEFHSSRRAFDRGHWRVKELQAAGYLVVPFTATDLRRPKQVVSTVQRVLWERGHPDVVNI